jgi:hypothetical protein
METKIRHSALYLRNWGFGLGLRLLILAVGSVLALAQEPQTPAPVEPTAATPVTPVSSSDAIILDPPPAYWHGRLAQYGKSLVGPQLVFDVLPVALWDHVRKFPKEWGSDGKGFADRLGSEYAQFFLSQSIQLAFSALHKEDTR